MTPILEQPHTTSHVHYMAVNPKPVERFLAEHPIVTQVLLEAKKPLQNAFGKDVQVSVAVTSNPEVAEEDFLVSSIQTSSRLGKPTPVWTSSTRPGGSIMPRVSKAN